MGIEHRNGRAYYYRKVRRDGKVKSEYCGSGELAYMAKELQVDAAYSQMERNEKKRKQKEELQTSQQEILQLEEQLNELFTRIALASGYHKDKSRTWRKKRK
jgi:beta-phosphoglucomutase-like phosphatase (HAD superfamily)